MPHLVYRDSWGGEGSVELASEPLYVGRGLECAIRTDDELVSRKHARISIEDGRPVIEDLDSRNGSHVNRRRISAKETLSHADVIQCGSLSIQVLYADPDSDDMRLN